MAFQSIGCIQATPVFATQSWPAGSKSLGPVTLPDKFVFGALVLDLSQVVDLQAVITVDVEMSFDGVQFSPVGGYVLDLPNSGLALAAGGVGMVDQSGTPVRTTSKLLKFPQGTLATRAIRGTASLTQPAVVGMTLAIW